MLLRSNNIGPSHLVKRTLVLINIQKIFQPKQLHGWNLILSENVPEKHLRKCTHSMKQSQRKTTQRQSAILSLPFHLAPKEVVPMYQCAPTNRGWLSVCNDKRPSKGEWEPAMQGRSTCTMGKSHYLSVEITKEKNIVIQTNGNTW